LCFKATRYETFTPFPLHVPRRKRLHAKHAIQKNGEPSAYENVGGPCEGCEAVHESPVPFAQLSWTDTLPDFNEPGLKLKVSGTVYKWDGKTPAAGVVLYVYHTNQKGVYPKRGDETGWGRGMATSAGG
jgi:protocatechuate 3,4-dioxygenase beta subunit